MKGKKETQNSICTKNTLETEGKIKTFSEENKNQRIITSKSALQKENANNGILLAERK